MLSESTGSSAVACQLLGGLVSSFHFCFCGILALVKSIHWKNTPFGIFGTTPGEVADRIGRSFWACFDLFVNKLGIKKLLVSKIVANHNRSFQRCLPLDLANEGSISVTCEFASRSLTRWLPTNSIWCAPTHLSFDSSCLMPWASLSRAIRFKALINAKTR